MHAVGLITEYNPFHNGHLHHLQESLRAAGAGVSVVVMSGHFLQRGVPAQLDKWTRTEMALAAGVDVVLELPLPWACNSAPQFALGAVRTLDACGGIDTFCFGSEIGKLDPLQQCADLLLEQEKVVHAQTAARLRRGIPYPAARAAVLAEMGAGTAQLLAQPNNILGIEYLKALRIIGSKLRPLTIRRIGAGYHDPIPLGSIASATGIRRKLGSGEAIHPFLPPSCHALLQAAMQRGHCLDEDALLRLLAARLLISPAALRGIYQVENGIEQRLHAAALTATTFETLAQAVKSRQLTLTRVQRILCYSLLEVNAALMEDFLATGPCYLRLLGHSERGRRFLAATRKQRTLPLIANLSRAAARLKKFYANDPARCRCAEEMLELDLRATRIYSLLLCNRDGQRNRDYVEDVRNAPC